MVTEKDFGTIKKAAMVIDRGRIAWLGRQSQLKSSVLKASQIKVTTESDFGGQTVLPGFVEAHTHVAFAGDRQNEFELRNQGQSYADIAKKGGGIQATMKATAKVSESDLLTLAQSRVDRFVRQGVVCLEAKSGYGPNAATELKILNVHRKLKGPEVVSTFLGLHAVPKSFSSSADYTDWVIKKLLPKVTKGRLADRVDAFVEKGYFSKKDARAFFHAAKLAGLSFTIHADQLNRTTAYDLAIDEGGQSADHLVQLSAGDITRLAKSSVVSGLLPAADFYLKMAYPKARALLDQGGRVFLATDYNPGSSPTGSLNFVGVLARLEMKMTLAEVLCAYTLNAAEALGRSDDYGVIDTGRKANFIQTPADLDQLFYDIGHHPITATYKSGKKI